MIGRLLAAAVLAGSASAHVALWDKGMFGYNYPYQADDPNNNNYNNNDAVTPLREYDNLSVDQWFAHGYKGYPPKDGDFMVLPAGGSYNAELNCNRAGTSMRDPTITDPLPLYACGGEGALHTVNRFNNSDVDPTKFGGTALAIAYTSDVASLQPSDMTVISVVQAAPWFRANSYAIPAGLPPCPEGGCLCTWNWIHQSGHGEGYGQEIYNNLYRCIVTGATDSTKVVQKGAVPRDCTGSPSTCVKGPKTPMYLYQASGNNLPDLDVPPNYNDNWGFAEGAQNDVFIAPSVPAGAPDTPTATALPTGWSAMGCYKDQNQRSLPVFLSSTNNNTIESCVDNCDAGGYIYAGVEGNECWCSGPSPTLVAANASDCNKPCGGDGWATCGGDWRINVFKAPNAPSTIAPPVVASPFPTASLPSGWSEVGCVIDSPTSRTLDRGSTSSNNNTVLGCIAQAKAMGVPYAGVQYGSECWFGDADSQKNIVLGDGCNVACAGDKATICGGSYRLNVFVDNALLAQSATTTTSSAASSTSTAADSTLPVVAPSATVVSSTLSATASTTSIVVSSSSAPVASSSSSSVKTSDAGSSSSSVKSSDAASTSSNAVSSSTASSTKSLAASSSTISTKPIVASSSSSSSSAATTAASSSITTNVAVPTTTLSSSTIRTTTSTSTSSTAPTPTISLPAGWKDLGCQIDSSSRRLLPDLKVFDRSLTPQSCIATCSAKGYPYAGTQFGSECWCASKTSVPLAPASGSGSVSGCTSMCRGDNKIMCGGNYRLNVYSNATDVTVIQGKRAHERRRMVRFARGDSLGLH